MDPTRAVAIVTATQGVGAGARPGVGAGGMVLVPGQVVEGRVTRDAAAGAVLELAGVRLPVELSAQLAAEGRLPLLVRAASADRIVLQIVTASAPGTYPTPADEELAQALRTLGLAGTEPQLTAARQLASDGQPLTRAAVLRLSGGPAGAADAGDAEPGPRNPAAALGELGLPDEPGLRALVAQFTSRSLSLAGDSLRATWVDLQRAGMASPEHAEAAALLRSLGVDLTENTVRLAGTLLSGRGARPTDVERLAAALEQLAESPPLPTSADGDAPTQGPASAARDAAAQLRQLASLGGADREQLVRGLKTLFSAQGVSLEHRLLAADAGPGQRGQPTPDLRAQLAVTQSAIEATTASSAADVSARLVGQLAPEVVDNLQARQLANAATNPARPDDWFSFQAPVRMPSGAERGVEIRIRPRPGSDEIDPRHVRLVLRLEHDEIGGVEVGLQVSGQQLSCAIECETPAGLQRATAAWDQLRASLQSLGYGVARPSLRLEPAAPAAAPAGEAAAPASIPSAPRGIDARA